MRLISYATRALRVSGRLVSAVLAVVLATSVGAVPVVAGARLTSEVSVTELVNTAPTKWDESLAETIWEDGSLLTFNPRENYHDAEEDPLTVEFVSWPSSGAITPYDANSYTYSPEPQWHGTDTVAFRVSDGEYYSEITTLTIEVLSVQDAPIAEGDSATCAEDTFAAIWLFENDYDNDGESFSASITDEPAHGTLTTATASGHVTYTPDADFNGLDEFRYTVSDGTSDSEVAVVRITVTPVAEVTTFTKMSGSKTLAKYGDSYTYSGRLISRDTSLSGVIVQLLECSSQTGTYTPVAGKQATTTVSGGFSFSGLKPTSKTWYRVTYAGITDVQDPATSTAVYVLPRAYVSNPAAPSTMYTTKSYSVTGSMKPAHSAGSYPIRIYKYRYVSGRWKSYGYVKAKASNITGGSKYTASVKLPYRGRWRLRAYHTTDTGHYASWSSGYDYVTVR